MGVPGVAGSFPCPECPTKLSRKSDLKQHMNSHTDKFKCHICGKRHSRASGLTEHIAKKHKGLPNTPSETSPNLNQDASPPLPQSGAEAYAPKPSAIAFQAEPLSLYERLEKVKREEREVASNFKDDVNTPRLNKIQSHGTSQVTDVIIFQTYV